MSTIVTFGATAEPGLAARLVTRAADLARRIAARHRSRREVALLLEAEPRVLADIGLTSTDVRAALAVPFPADPGSLLASFAAERRAAAWATARELGAMKRHADSSRADAA